MAKACCKKNNPEPYSYWKVWPGRIGYRILIGILLFVFWSQLTHQQ